MSDSFITLAFQDVKAAQAHDAQFELIQSLQMKQIISSPDSGAEITEFRPGPQATSILAFPQETHFLSLQWNMVAVHLGPRIFSEIIDAEFTLTCRKCIKHYNGFKKPVVSLLSRFVETPEQAVFQCENCDYQENLQYCDTKGFAASFLGVTFWNWGELVPEFIEDLEKEFASRINVIRGVVF